MFPWFMEYFNIYIWKFKHIEETDSTKETTEKKDILGYEPIMDERWK